MKTLLFKVVVAYWAGQTDYYCDAVMACDPAQPDMCEVMVVERCAMTLDQCLDSTVFWRGRELMTYGCANAPRPRHLDVETPTQYRERTSKP